MYLLTFVFIPKIDPKRMNYDFFETNFYKIRLLIVISLMAGSFAVAHSGLIGRLDVSGKTMLAGIFLFLSVLGSFMIKLKPNWFIGIRTPWTLSSDTVWTKTHKLGGRIYFFGGLLCLGLTVLLRRHLADSSFTEIILLWATACFWWPILIGFFKLSRMMRRIELTDSKETPHDRFIGQSTSSPLVVKQNDFKIKAPPYKIY